MNDKRKEMNKALQKVVVPQLRKCGFKGSLPHFRRINAKNIDLITFQYNKWGGSFVVLLATCNIEGMKMSGEEFVPPNKVTAHDVDVEQRYRLGAPNIFEDGIWFDFENAETNEDFEKIALEVWNMLCISDTEWISSFFK